ncbi:PIR protein [Plasmodium yoelii]|uniref:PIR protein n=2 Tax=Plasmodium yoelii TaxID=5861 RepID=A0AAF0AY89_PLAYO|nr:PIR protein [Plasmodium yoelii]WBY54642.1 PIR protein [Plasmodium yoelii yoelii]CDS44172.1 YIR protein [Plasmodium yoelii]VTZ71635.1 PIR protein [Plasmodium yoelii]|eukprot:XP_022810961.1 PIR protein [Plasmodium yoelii]
MNKEVCIRFKNVREWLPRESIEVNNINDNENLKKYCDKGSCDGPFDKISAGCLYLFDEFFADYSQFNSVANRNINIVDYILIWLGYMLNLTIAEGNGSIETFYETYINNGDTDNKYNKLIEGVTGYQTYNELVDIKEDLMSIDIKAMSKFYDAFILLCDICTGVDENSSNCDNNLEKAKKFAKKYDELNEDYYNGRNSPYNQLLSTLSYDYYNLKSICNDFPLLPTYSRKFVIKSTLISIGFIFVAVSIFLGIAYKYSLLGFRKRFKKQQIRERIKNIKKKMTNNIC